MALIESLGGTGFLTPFRMFRDRFPAAITIAPDGFFTVAKSTVDGIHEMIVRAQNSHNLCYCIT